MQIADVGGERRQPQATGERGVCPCCKAEVIAKCGTLVVQHWAHRAVDCDPWSEPESEWHQFWKAAVAPPERREVVIGSHRADAVLESGIVVEVQRSPISAAEIKEREAYYTVNCVGMVWVLTEERRFSRAFSVSECAKIVVGPAETPTWFRDDDGWNKPLTDVSRLADVCRLAWVERRQIRLQHERAKAEWQRQKDRAEEDKRRRHAEWDAKTAPLMAKHRVDFETAVQMAMANEIASKRQRGSWQWRCLSFKFSASFAGFFDSVVERMKAGRDLSERQSSHLARMYYEIVHGSR